MMMEEAPHGAESASPGANSRGHPGRPAARGPPVFHRSTPRCLVDSSQSDRRILFVDDDADIRSAFARSVGGAGFEVDLASSGHQALRLFRAHAYPVVATDLRMPELDGIGLMKSLTSVAPATVFVVVTGFPNLLSFSSDSELERSISSLVAKPWDHKELVEVLERALNLHGARARILGRSMESGATPLLLVDESEDDARVFSMLLKHTDYSGRDVVRATSLSDALPLVREQDFELIVTDLALPDARGLDTVHRLRTASPNTAMMVLAGFWDEVLAMKSLEMGAQDYLVKPNLDAGQLNRAIHYALKRKRSEQSLARLAFNDALTGLLSPFAFRERLRHALSVARRHRRRVATMLLDLDGLGEVNDRLGFAAGNAVLRRFAVRLQNTLRETDTLARLSGSEFGVLLEDVDPMGVGIVTERLLSATSKPIELAGSHVAMDWNVGVALYPESGEYYDELLASARASLTAGKRRAMPHTRVEVVGEPEEEKPAAPLAPVNTGSRIA